MEFEQWLGTQLPVKKPDASKAEIQRIMGKFGFKAVIDYVAEACRERETDIALWSAREFYAEYIYRSWKDHAQDEYMDSLKKTV